nr:hypothetical protein [Ktedonobacteraceae bacterium]
MDTLSTHTAAEPLILGEDAALDTIPTPAPPAPQEPTPGFRAKWFAALREVFPIYLSVHMAFFVITCLAGLFTSNDFHWAALPLHTLWASWLHWDTGIYIAIASHSYDTLRHTAFFPLYPLLEWI